MCDNLKRTMVMLAPVLVAMLPVILLRDFTPNNELRYLSIADEALRDHHLFTFFNHGVMYADKPPLYFWIIMACKLLVGRHSMPLLALFSIVPACVTAVVMNRWTATVLNLRWRSVATLMLMTNVLFLGSAVFLRMDMLMCMFIVLALRAEYGLMCGVGDRKRLRWLFPFYIFMGVFTKGGVALAAPLVSALAFAVAKRNAGMFFKTWNVTTVAVLSALFLMWFGGVYIEGGWQWISEMLVHQTLGRTVNSFHHGQPFWWYVPTCAWLMLPYTPIVLLYTANALRRGLMKGDVELFMLSSAVSMFAMLSAISSKLGIYLLPLFPVAVYLSAIALARMDCGKVAMVVRGTAFTLCAVCYVAGMLMPFVNDYIGYGRVSREVSIMESVHGVSGASVFTCGLGRSENMDVYLHRRINVIPKDSLRSDRMAALHLHNAILVVPTEKAAKMNLHGAQNVGRYSMVFYP